MGTTVCKQYAQPLNKQYYFCRWNLVLYILWFNRIFQTISQTTPFAWSNSLSYCIKRSCRYWIKCSVRSDTHLSASKKSFSRLWKVASKDWSQLSSDAEWRVIPVILWSGDTVIISCISQAIACLATVVPLICDRPSTTQKYSHIRGLRWSLIRGSIFG